MTELRKGQKVRVSYEAVVTVEPGDRFGWLEVRNPAPSRGDITLGLQTVTIEPIEDLRDGDTVLTSSGTWLLYDGGYWKTFAGLRLEDGAWCHRPFKLHIRDGEVLS